MAVFEQLSKRFWPNGWQPNIWAIFDAARDPRIYTKVQYSGLLRECLFAGDLPGALQHASPYLVQLEHDDRRAADLVNEAWDNSWCVFLEADVGMKTLRKHLRTLLRVQGPDGKFLLFRYYDPRVLRAYLPTCTSEELTRFCGPVKRFWTEEGNGSDQVLQFELRAGRLDKTSFPAKVERQA